MTDELGAVLPNPDRTTSRMVHLYLEGWEPPQIGQRNGARRPEGRSLCGTVSTAETWTNYQGRTFPTRVRRAPFDFARTIVAGSSSLVWCHACIGRAAQHYGTTLDVVSGIAAARGRA